MNEPLVCSSDGEPIMGTIAVVGSAADEDTFQWDAFRGPVYEGTEKKFLLLHPKCLHDLLDEVLRQEGSTAIVVSIGSVENVREALQM